MRKGKFNIGRNRKIKIFIVPKQQLRKLPKRDSGPLIDEDISKKLVSSLAIEIWRLEKRINKIKNRISGDSDKEFNSLLDQMQRIKDVFKKQEIEIREHTGNVYNDGLSCKALYFEEVNGIPKGKMQVIETIKPSVYFKGQIIFHGEVIVGKSKEK